MRKRMLTWVLSAVLLFGAASTVQAQITVPHVFTTSVPVSQLNTDLSTLGTGALNRAGGTITGNITVTDGVTIDDVDISAVLDGTGSPSFVAVDVTSTAADALDVAGGITAGSGNVAIVDVTGKIPALSSTYFASLDGSNLTGIVFSQLPTTWSSVSYSSGDFTANGSMTWTVGALDIGSNIYFTMDKTFMWSVQLNSTTVGGTANSELRVDAPGSVVFNRTCAGSFHYVDAGTAGNGFWQALAGTSYLTLRKDANSTNWTVPATDTTSIYVTVVCEIQ